MPLPRIQFTLTRLMLAVAVVAIVLAAGVESVRLFSLSRRYSESASRFTVLTDSHLDSCAQWKQMAQNQRSMAESLRHHQIPDEFTELDEGEKSDLESLQKTASLSPASNHQLNELYGRFAVRCDSFAQAQHDFSIRLWRKAEYYSALRWKYDRAASRPWLSVPPDPPEPE